MGDLTIEIDPVTSESHYQQGPDTYLLQLRDTDFPCRLRQYMKIAADRSPNFAHQLRTGVYDYENMREAHFPDSTDRYQPEHNTLHGQTLGQELRSRRTASRSVSPRPESVLGPESRRSPRPGSVLGLESQRSALDIDGRHSPRPASLHGRRTPRILCSEDRSSPPRPPPSVDITGRRVFHPRQYDEFIPTRFEVPEENTAHFNPYHSLEDQLSKRSQIIHRSTINVLDSKDMSYSLRHHTPLHNY